MTQVNVQPREEKQSAVKAAFPHTIPVLTGYLFMGMAFGILLQSKGYGVIWAFAMALFIYAGSGQFVAVGLMASGFDPLTAMLMTLMVNARYLFYGIPLLEKFSVYKGLQKLYMIFAITDETFALINATEPPQGVSKKQFYFSIAWLDHVYWIVGCTAGALIGSAMPIDTKGIDFVMTALFVVIFLEQWQQKSGHKPALIGLGVSFACRLIFGPQWFILAAMAGMVLVFSILRKPLEKAVKPK